MAIDLPIDIDSIKGFLAEDEAQALFDATTETAALGPALEIGSYCGKSTIYMGSAAKASDGIVYALDHHRGSEEHQPGEYFHDPDLIDTEGKVDTFREFRRNIAACDLNDTVIPLVTDSKTAVRHWTTRLGMVFIDGGHSLEAALSDYRCWAVHVAPGGILAIHDVFPDAHEGGQAPYTIYRMAVLSGLFEEIRVVNTLALLRRL
jgi:predicted O-methyltransferase YrrM